MADDAWKQLWTLLARIPGKREEAVAVLNGFFGDKLDAKGSTLALSMELRSEAAAIDWDAELADQFAEPSPHVVVLVHGLMAMERCWTINGPDGYGQRLRRDAGVTPLYLRYNTGLHISANGRELSRLLERLVGRWPVPVESISVVSHSMGGLVARSASHYGHQGGAAWTQKLERLFLLGVPSRGASLEQLVNVAAFTLNTIPNLWTRAIGWGVNQRSAGIKDLRHGYLVDEEWQGRRSDALSFGRRHPIELIPDVDHFVIAGTLAADKDHPLAAIFGDAMVTPWSARDAKVGGTTAEHLASPVCVLPGVSHAALMQHEQVYEKLIAWWPDPQSVLTVSDRV